jgi:hypothetical protein
VELQLPKRFTELCIVDVGQCESLKASRPLMYSLCLAGSENVFLVPKQETPIFLPDISVPDPGYVCVPVAGGKAVLRLEGLGKSTLVSEWPVE